MTGFSQSERRGLAQMQAEQPHPDADQLTAFAEQTLTAREREQVLAHLAVCTDCRDVAGYAAPEIAQAAPAEVLKPAFWRWPALRWAAVAASAVVVVASVSIGLHERATKPGPMATMTSETASVPEKQQAADPTQGSRQPTDVIENKTSGGATGVKSAEVRYEKLPQDQLRKDATPADVDKKLAQAAPPQRLEAGRPAMGNAVRDAAEPQESPSTGRVVARKNDGLSQSKVNANVTAQSAAGPQRAQQDEAYPANAVVAQKNEYAAPEPQAPAATATIARAKVAPAEQVQSQGAELQAQSVPAMKAQIEKRAGTKELERLRDTGKNEPASLDANYSQAASLQWQISANGLMQRSADHGRTWQPVMSNTKFRAVAVVGTEIWAGGPGGLLMHSPDNGQSWVRITPATKSVTLTGDVISLHFIEPTRGSVTTSAHETWITNDGGKTWKKQ